MRLYHWLAMWLALALLLAGCASGAPTAQAMVTVQIEVDGQQISVELPAGSSVQQALDQADVTLGELDRVEPAPYEVLAEDGEIKVTRIYEEFEIEQVVIPFEQQLQPSEFLLEGTQQPLQLGENGLKEITYRVVYEDGVEVSRTEIKVVVVKEAVPQIMLVGVQSSFTPRSIPGRLVYLSDGNAWVMEGSTASRTPIVTTGDLDGRVFSLSDDGEWLLFTRRSEDAETINTLWAVNLRQPEVLYDLQVQNVIHFADWLPGSTSRVAFSTVEPREAAPGWQANNDLRVAVFSVNGWVDPTPEVLVETNSGGVYGWWGINYLFGATADNILYAGPDQIGFVDVENGTLLSWQQIIPLETYGDWAWVPGVAWSEDGNIVYLVRHAPPPGSTAPEESQNFNLTAVPLSGGSPVDLVSQVGMFAYPLLSPASESATGGLRYQVAYLQAIFPEQSETSRYRLMLIDRDGSNRRALFPPPEAPGIEPRQAWGAWSPDVLPESGGRGLVVLYQGNLWLVDSLSGEAFQITGEGRISRVDWK